MLLVRFKAYYLPWQAFYRLMEITWFGLPILKGVDYHIDGRGGLKITGLIEPEETGEKIDQAQNLVLWGEAIWTPSVYLTDSRVRWEAVDEKTAWLVIPFSGREEAFLVRFDPQTEMIQEMSAERYIEAERRPRPPGGWSASTGSPSTG